MKLSDSHVSDSVACPARELAGLLSALRAWALRLAPADYTRRPERLASTVGQHLRHSLDHVQALVAGVASGCACYDQRQRGTADELDRDRAVARIDALLPAVRALADLPADQAVAVELLINPAQGARCYPSCLGRELAFVLTHAIHHNALMGAIVVDWGYAMPPTLSTAPATQAHDATKDGPCAP
jgi:uncharacterized damage-inducible protein DinB